MPDSNAALVLQEFGNKIGLPQIAFNESRVCALSFDDIIVNLELSADTRMLTAYLWIAEIAPERRAEVAVAVADANFLFSGTHGATLGMNRSSGDIALAAQLPDATLTLAAFEQTLENLVNIAEAWQQRLASGNAPATEDAAPPVSGDITGFLRA